MMDPWSPRCETWGSREDYPLQFGKYTLLRCEDGRFRDPETRFEARLIQLGPSMIRTVDAWQLFLPESNWSLFFDRPTRLSRNEWFGHLEPLRVCGEARMEHELESDELIITIERWKPPPWEPMWWDKPEHPFQALVRQVGTQIANHLYRGWIAGKGGSYE